MNASHSDCRCNELADGAAGKVLTCPECGAVHLALSEVALRLDRPAFRNLVHLLSRAQLALEREGVSYVPVSAHTDTVH